MGASWHLKPPKGLVPRWRSPSECCTRSIGDTSLSPRGFVYTLCSAAASPYVVVLRIPHTAATSPPTAALGTCTAIDLQGSARQPPPFLSTSCPYLNAGNNGANNACLQAQKLFAMPSNEAQPLLYDDRQAQRDAENDHVHEHIVWLSPAGEDSYLHTTRTQTQRFLTSKFGHYAVLLLVSLDVSCIFADFLISLYTCEQSCTKGKHVDKEWGEAQSALGIVSLVFSCLFMTELLASIWAFGLP